MLGQGNTQNLPHHQNMLSFNGRLGMGFDAQVTQDLKHTTHRNMESFGNYVSMPCPHAPCAPHPYPNAHP